MHARQNETARRFTSADWLAACIGCAAVLTGVLVLVLAHGTIAFAIGTFLLGVGGIAFVALVFLLVGESEDRHYRKEAL
jgi:divalent metal cation (Fe/Co/Zn/Cd) transporter